MNSINSAAKIPQWHPVEAQFIGKDGSEGFFHSQFYHDIMLCDLKDGRFWIVQNETKVLYESLTALLKNWKHLSMAS